MLKLKQYFCRHDFRLIATDKYVTANLYQCSKCKVYEYHHWILPMAPIKYKNVDKGRFNFIKED